ncbi:MAG TPA: ABC transporter ATP-binding protein [Terriglobales bacterium]|nr:ABC transporter ATP-binding protein [Terriglobales bacterium]
MHAIEISGLKKSYTSGFWRKQQKWGLKDLSLTVEEGEIFGCLGPNGAGKTTTLKILMGLIFPTAGSAKILGSDIGDPSVKSSIGFLPEQPYFYDYLTPNELLGYYARLSGVPASAQEKKTATALERVGMADSAKVQLRKFSKGMLQRVGIAQAIIHDPKIVFLDEPMSGLDPIGRHEVRQLIQELRDEGKTVFFSTHILSDAEALCDRVAVMHKGELRGVGVVSELTAKATGSYELLWDGAEAVQAISAMGVAPRNNGGTVSAVVEEPKLHAALDAIHNSKGRLISVNPVRGTLEQYFLEHIEGGNLQDDREQKN